MSMEWTEFKIKMIPHFSCSASIEASCLWSPMLKIVLRAEGIGLETTLAHAPMRRALHTPRTRSRWYLCGRDGCQKEPCRLCLR